MTDLAERAIARLSEIDDTILQLEYERDEISTALKVLSTFLEPRPSDVQTVATPHALLQSAEVTPAPVASVIAEEAPASSARISPETAEAPERLDSHPADPLRSGVAEGNEADLAAPGVAQAAVTETPPAPSAKLGSWTVKDRIRARHRQQPTWTARMIANDLGLNLNSVATFLAAIRKEEGGEPDTPTPPAPPPETSRAELLAGYAAVKKRLGAPA